MIVPHSLDPSKLSFAYGARPSLREWGERRGYASNPVELATHRPAVSGLESVSSPDVLITFIVIARSVLSPHSSPTSVGWEVASLATHTTPRGACPSASLSLSPSVTDSLDWLVVVD